MKKITFYPTLLILLITLFAFKNTLIETDLIQVKGGTFKMGSKTSDTSAELDEQKEHSVTLNTFEISKFEVTVWEWKQFIKANKMKIEKKNQIITAFFHSFRLAAPFVLMANRRLMAIVTTRPIIPVS